MKNADGLVPGEIIEKHWKPANDKVKSPMTDRKSSLNAIGINMRDPPSSLIPSMYKPGINKFRQRNSSVFVQSAQVLDTGANFAPAPGISGP